MAEAACELDSTMDGVLRGERDYFLTVKLTVSRPFGIGAWLP